MSNPTPKYSQKELQEKGYEVSIDPAKTRSSGNYWAFYLHKELVATGYSDPEIAWLAASTHLEYNPETITLEYLSKRGYAVEPVNGDWDNPKGEFNYHHRGRFIGRAQSYDLAWKAIRQHFQLSNQATDPDEKERGLYQKYTILRNETGKPLEERAFVLVPSKDKAARDAIRAYAFACQRVNPDLANDLFKWLETLEAV